MSDLRIGALRGGGVVVGYRCSSRCRHCLYACGPHRRDGELAEGQQLDAFLDLLAVVGPRARYHIGGGEPFLQPALLEALVAGMSARRLALDYIETNAVWADGVERVEQTLTSLASAGLQSLLVSLSPFHAEFVALERTRLLVQAADRILPAGSFVWIPEFAAELQQPQDQRLDLTELLERRGDVYAIDLCLRYGLVPGGRAGRFMHRYGVKRHYQELLGDEPRCGSRLADTSHFHIDLQGAYVPGLCAGITLPAEELSKPIDLDAYPLLAALVEGGVGALVQLACDAGFKPNSSYSAPCDLCGHARTFLWRAAPGRYRELGPAGFYDSRSLDWDD